MKRTIKRNIAIFATSILVTWSFASCLTVSLTGSNINPNAKTVTISTFTNNASYVNPSLSQDFTTALIDKIQSQTPLMLTNNNGDYTLEGEIINYNIAPIAIQGNDVAAMNRLTITVRVRFTSKYDEDGDFEQTFSRYADYSSTENFTAREGDLVATINDALTDDIFNRAFVNW